MTIPFVGTGGLFTRVGREGGILNALNTARNAATLDPYINNIHNQYLATLQFLADDIYNQEDAFRSSQDDFLTYINAIASNTVIDMAVIDQNINPADIDTAMALLIVQLVANAQTVEKPVVSATATAGSSNTGNGVAVVSVKNGYGVQKDYIYDENIIVLCSSDSHTGGATAGSEPFSITGEAALDNMLSYLWPTGSGAESTVDATDGELDNDGNVQTNSSFEDFTANLPDQWTLIAGVAGTTILNGGSGQAFVGTGCLAFVGDSASFPTIDQLYDDAGVGTEGALLPNTLYAVNVWVKASVVPAAGVVKIRLVNSAGTVITDDAGGSNDMTITVSGITTGYVAHSATFITPKILPVGYKLRIITTTAITTGSTLYIDDLAVVPMTECYTGGPSVAVFSGSTDFLLNDYFTLAAANNYAGAFQLVFQQFFDMNSLGLQLPSASSPTISDSLVA